MSNGDVESVIIEEFESEEFSTIVNTSEIFLTTDVSEKMSSSPTSDQSTETTQPMPPLPPTPQHTAAALEPDSVPDAEITSNPLHEQPPLHSSVSSMKFKDVRSELKQLGVSTAGFVEKQEFFSALEKARRLKAWTQYPKGVEDVQTTEADSARKSTEESASDPVSASSLSLKQLRKELSKLGISTSGFVEKNEFVSALETAREAKSPSSTSRSEKTPEMTEKNPDATPHDDANAEAKESIAKAEHTRQCAQPASDGPTDTTPVKGSDAEAAAKDTGSEGENEVMLL